MTISVVVVDDLPEFRLAFGDMISAASDMRLAALSETVAGGLALLDQGPVDILLVDLCLPDGSGLTHTSFAGISSEGMKPGAARLLTREELLDLKKAFGVPRKLPSLEGVARAAAAFITKRRPARLRVDDHGHAKPGFRGEPSRTPREGHATSDEPPRFRAAGPSEERRDRRPRPQGEGFQGKPRAPRSRDEGTSPGRRGAPKGRSSR